MKYLVRVLAAIDESTRIGGRDAAMLVIGYGMLSRSIEVTDLLIKQVRVDHDGVWVFTAKSKTRRKGEGRWRFIRDRPDLQIVRRILAWLGDLRELGAYQPTLPLFRALTTTGNLKGRANATVRGLHLTAGPSTRWSRSARPPPACRTSTGSRSPPTRCARARTPT
jgi:hypothetical protein